MLRVTKSSGRVQSSAHDNPTANSKGSVELSLSNAETGPTFQFIEKGNYGKVRWSTTVQVTRQEVEQMVRAGQDYLDGKVETTVVAPQEQLVEHEVAVTPEGEETFELVNGNR